MLGMLCSYHVTGAVQLSPSSPWEEVEITLNSTSHREAARQAFHYWQELHWADKVDIDTVTLLSLVPN